MTLNEIKVNKTTSRREFLNCGIGAAVGAGACMALGRLHSFAAETTDAAMKSRMRIGLATYQWGKDWDIPALLANCPKAGIFGVELRTSSKYAHGVETTINARATGGRQKAVCR